MNSLSKFLRHGCILGLLLALLLTAACSAPATPQPAAEPTPAAAPTEVLPTAAPLEPTEAPPTAAPTEPAEEPGTGDLTPATAAAEGLEPAVFKALGVEATLAEVPFTDPLSDTSGTSAQLLVEGTGVEFRSLDEVMGALELVFESHGWTADDMYVADGPTGTARGFRQEETLAVVMVQWEPAPDADCPEDQPISECDLAPEQILYTITIDCVLGL